MQYEMAELEQKIIVRVCARTQNSDPAGAVSIDVAVK